jgi:hypothetical protein
MLGEVILLTAEVRAEQQLEHGVHCRRALEFGFVNQLSEFFFKYRFHWIPPLLCARIGADFYLLSLPRHLFEHTP